MANKSIQDLYEGLQLFRQYVESNMPYKETVYFGDGSPDTEGKLANLGAMYFKVDPSNTVVQDIFYKAGLSDTDWLKFGSGGTSTSVNLNAGLNVLRTADMPFALDLTLLNSQGSTISLTTPLTLNFLNLVDTEFKNYFTEVLFTDPLTLQLPSIQTLGILPDTDNQKVYVYVGLNVDTQEKILAVKANSRIDANYVTTVYDFGSSTDSNKVYAELGSNSAEGEYNLKLVAIMQVKYVTGEGWYQPTLVLPYAPELDTISEKLLSYAGTSEPSRRQLIDGDTLKDFQIKYNELVEQTYSESNSTKTIEVTSNYTLSEEDFLRYQAIIFVPTSNLLTVTIPVIEKERSIYLKNSSEFILNIYYTIAATTETNILLTGNTKHLNFCGSDNVDSPYIKPLDIKYVETVPDYFAVVGERLSGAINIQLNHPLKVVINPQDFIEINLNKLNILTTDVSNYSQKIYFTESPLITIQDSASLGLSSTGLDQQIHIYIYYKDASTYGMAISSVDKLDLSVLHDVQLLSTVSSAKGLYANVAVNDVALYYVGAVTYNYFLKQFSGSTIGNQFTQDEILLNISEVTPAENFSLVESGDSFYEAFLKTNDNATYLKAFSEELRKTQNISKLVLTNRSPADSYGTLNLDLSSGTDVNGLPTRLGERYCVMDFSTPREVAVLGYGGIFVAEVVDSTVTLNYVDYLDKVVLEGGGKTYLIWIANVNDFDPLGNAPRIRIISVYPDTSADSYFNFKTLNTASGSYNALANDALLLGNTTTEFTINLPDNATQGSKIEMYFSSVAIAYTQQYIIAHPTGEPFYQTADATITVNNGGFVLTFEYTEINGVDKYWFVTSGDYNA